MPGWVSILPPQVAIVLAILLRQVVLALFVGLAMAAFLANDFSLGAALLRSVDTYIVGSMAAHVVLPWTHRVFANLKRWALGVYHGLRRKHLQTYLDEFVFRFNRRRARHAAFRSLLRIATKTEPVTYKMLIQPEPAG